MQNTEHTFAYHSLFQYIRITPVAIRIIIYVFQLLRQSRIYLETAQGEQLSPNPKMTLTLPKNGIIYPNGQLPTLVCPNDMAQNCQNPIC